MKSFPISRAFALVTAVLAINVYAGDSKKEVVPMEQPEPSRWSLSIGVEASSIKATFQADPSFVATNLNGTSLIFPDPAVQYLNGLVGAAGLNNPGPGLTSFTGGTVTPLNADFRSVTFLGVRVGPPLPDSDTSPAVGPYIKLAYDAFDFDSNTVHLSPFAQYTFNTAFDDGGNPLPGVFVNTTYAGTTGQVAAGVLRYAPGFTLGTFYPNQTFSGPGLIGFIHSGVNIDMHTFTLGMELSKDIGDRVHLIAATGPTMNYFDAGMSSVEVGLPGFPPARSDDSKWRFGWVGKLGVQYDLDAKKRWFLEAFGDYHWVTPFTVSDGLANAKIDASSWSAELGIGFRF